MAKNEDHVVTATEEMRHRAEIFCASQKDKNQRTMFGLNKWVEFAKQEAKLAAAAVTDRVAEHIKYSYVCNHEDCPTPAHALGRNIVEFVQKLAFTSHDPGTYSGAYETGITFLGLDHHGEAELELNVNDKKGSVYVSKDFLQALIDLMNETEAAIKARKSETSHG